MALTERKTTIAAGAFSLGGIALFVGLATFALLAADVAAVSEGRIFNAYVWRVTRFTLLQAALSTFLSILFAIPLSLALARRAQFPGRVWIVRLLALPLGLPPLVAALGLIGIWGRQGVMNALLSGLGLAQPVSIYGLSGILIAHVFFNLPLAARFMLAGLERIPGEYWLIGTNLGMGRLSLFRFIEWPAIRGLIPGIAGLIFMLCATSFTLVLTLGGGPAASTIEVAIYQALRFDFDPPRVIALSLLQIVLTGLLLAVARLMTPPAAEAMTTGRPVVRFDGRDGPAKLLDAFVILLGVGFILLPLASVLLSGLRSDLLRLATDPMVHRALVTSLAIALCSALLCVLVTVALVTARQTALQPRRTSIAAQSLARAIAGGSSLVLLVPPVVLGAGWFLLLRPFGDVARFAPFIVVVINMMMALPFAYGILDPAVATHRARTLRLSESLGLRFLDRLRLVDGPSLRRPVLMAFSFACALSLGDLGAVALFGSQDMVTLPYLLYSRMGSYRTADAAGLALMLGLVCVLLTIIGTPGERKVEENADAR